VVDGKVPIWFKDLAKEHESLSKNKLENPGDEE
jgi:hypothetical protein